MANVQRKKLKVMHLIRSPQEISRLSYIAPHRIVTGLTKHFLKEHILGNIFVIGKDEYFGKDDHGQPLESMKSAIVIKHAECNLGEITEETYKKEGEEIIFPVLKEQIERNNPNIILAQNPLFSEIFALKRVKESMKNPPKIIDYCGCSPFTMKLSGKEVGGLDILVKNKDFFDGHVSISNYTRKVLEERGIESEVIYAGIDLEDFISVTQKPQDKIVMYSGRFHPDKGAQYIPEIIKGVLSKSKNVRFALAGYGHLEKEIRDELNMFNGSVQISAMKKKDLIQAYFRAHTYFQPSRIEAFCVSAVEAMAAGNNMVYSCLDSTCLGEIIGDAGTPVKELNPKLYSDAILENLNNEGSFNEKAVERVRDRFDIQKKSKEWMEYFEALVS